MNDNSILKKIKFIDDLPTLPTFAIEVNRMADEGENVSNKKLSQLIEKDQAMAALILKLANSAALGCRGKTCDIFTAITRIGPYLVRDAVISIAIIKAFSTLAHLKGFDIKNFWIHSISVALTAKYIAERKEIKAPNKCYIGGLLHDIGKLVLFAYFPVHFAKVWKRFRVEKITFHEAEKKEISTDHSKIGETLARIWKLPDHIVDTIGCHHELPESASDLDGLKIIHFSDVIVNRLTVGRNDRTDRFKMHTDVQEEMAPFLESEDEWHPEVAKEIESACAIFLG